MKKIIYTVVYFIIIGFFTYLQFSESSEKNTISDELRKIAKIIKQDTDEIMSENAEIARSHEEEVKRCYYNPKGSVAKLVGLRHKDCTNPPSGYEEILVDELKESLNDEKNVSNEIEHLKGNFYYKIFLKNIPNTKSCALSSCHKRMPNGPEKGAIIVTLPVKFEKKSSYNEYNDLQTDHWKVATYKENITPSLHKTNIRD